MKNSILLLVSILVIVSAIGFGSEIYLRHTVKQMSVLLDQLETEVRQQENPDAGLEALNDKWEHSKHTMELLAEHAHVLPIDEKLSGIEVLIPYRDKQEDVLEMIYAVRSELNNIFHQTSFRFENIF